MTRFTLRDLFWLTLVVGLALGWWISWNRERIATERNILIDWQLRVFRSASKGAEVTIQDNDLIVISSPVGIARITPAGATGTASDGGRFTITNQKP